MRKQYIKSSNYDLINEDLLAMLRGSCKQLEQSIYAYISSYSDRSLKELSRKLDEVLDLGEKVSYQINNRKNIESSRRPIKCGIDKETLIERINEVEPDDYSDWSVEELQELALNLGINIESSNQSFVVGKQINNSKSYLCEDGTYHSENEMCRPSIKIFNSKSDADKAAKRSKSGFVQEL